MASHAGRKLKSYTVEFKVEAVEWRRMNGENCSLTARAFGVDRKRIREWEGKYDSMVSMCHGKSKKKRKLHLGRCVSSALDSFVSVFILQVELL